MYRNRTLTITSILVSLMIASMGYGQNLIRNGSFDEEVYVHWQKDSWQDHGTLEVTTEKSKNGIKSLKISDTAQENDIMYKQEVQVKPNTYYKLSGWIASRDVGPATAIFGAIIGLESGLTGKVYAGNLKGTSDWKYAELYFKTSATHKSVTVQARLGMYFSTATGTAYFDDIQLVEVKEPVGEPFILDEPGDSNKQTDTQNATQPENVTKGLTLTTIPPFVWLLVVGFIIMGLNIFFTLKREKKAKAAKDATEIKKE